MTVGDLNFSMSISGASSVEDATDDVARSMEGVESATEAASAAQDKVQGELSATGDAAREASEAQEQLSRQSGSATNVVTSFGDALQDAAVAGPSAAANNISFLVEQFGDISRQAGGARAAFSEVASALTGAGGAVLAVQALTALGPALASFFSDAKSDAEDTAKAIDDLAKSVGSVVDVTSDQAADLELEFDAVGDAIGQSERRIRAIKEVQDALGPTGLVSDFESLSPLAQEIAQSLTEQSEGLTLSSDLIQQELKDEKAIRQNLKDQQSSLEQQLQIQERLAELGAQRKEQERSIAEFDVPDAQQVQGTVSLSREGSADLPSRLQGPQVSLSGLQGLAGSADSVREINALIKQVRANFNVLNNTEARNFIARLQKARQKMQQTKTVGAAVTATLQQGFVSLGGAIGQNLVGALSQAESAADALERTFTQVINSIVNQLAGLVGKLLFVKALQGILSGGVGLALPSVTGTVGSGIGFSASSVTGGASVSAFSGAVVQTGSGAAKLAGGTVEIPVEVLSQANDSGDRRRARTGRA